MLFLKGLWHGLRVTCGALYWLMTLYFLWVAAIFAGSAWPAALGVLALVVVLYGVRVVLRRRLKDGGAGDAIATAAYFAVFVWMYIRNAAGAPLG